jgi:hypothetical protein
MLAPAPNGSPVAAGVFNSVEASTFTRKRRSNRKEEKEVKVNVCRSGRR